MPKFFCPDPRWYSMEAFLVSTGVVGLAEIGDKTQILSLFLAARFQRPWPIICGIFCATIANHAAAGFAGTLFGDLLAGPWLRWILAASFFSVAVWALFPDKFDDDDARRRCASGADSSRPLAPDAARARTLKILPGGIKKSRAPQGQAKSASNSRRSASGSGSTL